VLRPAPERVPTSSKCPTCGVILRTKNKVCSNCRAISVGECARLKAIIVEHVALLEDVEKRERDEILALPVFGAHGKRRGHKAWQEAQKRLTDLTKAVLSRRAMAQAT